MPFGDNARAPKTEIGADGESKFESSYLKLPQNGDTIIRLLDRTENVFTYWRYYFWVPNVGGTSQERSITVGRDGPIKQYMASLGPDNPKFRKPQKRIMSNVLDRSDNKVKILDYGPQLLDKFTTYHQRVRNQKTFEPMNIWEFDVLIVSKNDGKDKKDVKRDAMPDMNQEPLSPELAALPIFDLAAAQTPMPDKYQSELLAGRDLNEIMRELGWGKLQPTVAQQ